MGRKITVIKKHKLFPDSIYQEKIVSKIINSIMKGGQKTVAENIFYESMRQVRLSVNEKPLKVLFIALENGKPLVELKSIRIGGVTHQIPIETSTRRQESLVIRWLIQHARSRVERKMEERIAKEILDLYSKKGLTFQKKEELHRRAENNRAFAHYRW